MLNDEKDKLSNNPKVPIEPTNFEPDHDRTVQPVFRTDRTEQPVVGTNTRTAQNGSKTYRSQEIDTRSFHDEPWSW